MQKVRKITLALMLTVGLVAAPLASASALTPGGTCNDVTIPVALPPGSGVADQTVAGTLCRPYGPTTKIDVLVHGGSYTRHYWDFTTNSPYYSFVKQTVATGRAVLYYDQLGAGASSHPVSTSLGLDSLASAAHQVVGWTHAQGYTDVTLIGHSIGSGTAIYEAGTYHDVNRVVVTSLLHRPTTIDFNAIYPAVYDPAFAGSGLDMGYLTTVPGTRGSLFYNTATASPAVIAEDEATKSVLSSTTVGDILAAANIPPSANPSSGITVPVLLVVGGNDNLFCLPPNTGCTQPSVLAAEAPYYANAASFQAAVMPVAGHDLALHPSAPITTAAINAWVASH